MTALQVRDCPTELYKELSSEARRQNRSIAQQMLTILENHYGRGPQAHVPSQSDSRGTRGERAARKRRLFEELGALPAFRIPAEYGDTATMVSRAREERW